LNIPGLRQGEVQQMPHLTTFTIESILRRAGVECEHFPLEGIWDAEGEPGCGDTDAVLLSTTFIWERVALARAIGWATERFPGATLIVGGQYSNLKYLPILKAHPEVDYVVRGDGEEALPRLLAALDGRGELGDVPNLVFRDAATGKVRQTPFEYVDLDAAPSPVPGALPDRAL
jgi:anaerobic magnesium-protoporphyrin IX monomethyl ester cyclase